MLSIKSNVLRKIRIGAPFQYNRLIQFGKSESRVPTYGLKWTIGEADVKSGRADLCDKSYTKVSLFVSFPMVLMVVHLEPELFRNFYLQIYNGQNFPGVPLSEFGFNLCFVTFIF